ncbi:LOW QUALITY PROTEIN: hypothetical protein U9M48_011515 [Paspalum notatum var. saurae]|uniref:F-box domain-containing protein n=1 Tax=Paspalum notatum var. saurae TaxID=547442 RepID=A0AAQ3WHK2_PASNO
MASPPPPPLRLRRRRSPPALMAELIEEILLRLPPEEPAYLVRAALVCKAWRGSISDGGFLRRYHILLLLPPDEPAHLIRASLVCKAWRTMLSGDVGFLRRYREYHATPPLLGYLHNTLRRPRFVPTSTTPVPFFTAASSSSRVIDCRHGRVLIYYYANGGASSKFDVWTRSPVTERTWCRLLACVRLRRGGALRRARLRPPHLPRRPVPCGPCPDTVRRGGGRCVAQATVYSSTGDAWAATTAAAYIDVQHSISMGRRPSLLIGDVLYFTLVQWGNGMGGMLKYDLGRHVLSVIDTTGVPKDAIAIRAEDGGLGFVAATRNHIHLISSPQRAADAAGGGGWVQRRAIKIWTLLPVSLVPSSSCQPRVIGYLEGTDTVFLDLHPRVFTLNLKSRLLRMLSTHKGSTCVAYMSFYTPEEILLRLPPDEPAHLFRAALVCKSWRSTISDGGFLRRYREFHRTPPLLGYFFQDTLRRPRLVSTSATPVPFAKPPEASWIADCRHGRVLIDYGCWPFTRLDVWDPITGHTTSPPKHYFSHSYAAAVLCAAAAEGGCDHLACHGGPFCVVLVHSGRSLERGYFVQASVYSSATGAWSATTASVHCSIFVGGTHNLLIGDALYFTGGSGTAGMLKYDLARHVLSVIDTPGVPRNAIAVRAEDGGLGFLSVSRNRIHLISSWRQADDGKGGGGWVRHRAIKLGTLLPKSPCQPRVIGYVEGMDAVFLNTNAKVFALELKSRLVRRLPANKGSYSYFVAYTSFYTPALMVELIEEILLRLPPDEPAHLFRAALVCKSWRSTISDGGFLRRYREFHRTPPLLGYLHDYLYRPLLVPTSATPVPFSKPPAVSTSRVVDCRHGRVLIDYDRWLSGRFVVWDPITRHTKHVTPPPHHYNSYSCNAAVLCAADGGCDHLACHGGPFRMVLVHTRQYMQGPQFAQATVYSSSTGAWSATAASVPVHRPIFIGRTPSLLIGDALYFILEGGSGTAGVLKYDLARHALSVIDTRGVPRDAIAVRAEDGGLGFLAVSRNRIHLITSLRRQADDGGIGNGGGWVRHRAIKLGALLPKSPCLPCVIGYIEGMDAVFLSTNAGVFALELKSRLVRSSTLLGYLCATLTRPRLISTSTTRIPFFSKPASSSTGVSRSWVTDCCHGRVLIDYSSGPSSFDIWDPVTGRTKHLVAPSSYSSFYSSTTWRCSALWMAATTSAATAVRSAWSLSRGTSSMGNPSRRRPCTHPRDRDRRVEHRRGFHRCPHDSVSIGTRPSLLIGDALYFTISFITHKGGIGTGGRKYDLGRHALPVIETPRVPRDAIAIRAEDGMLGFVTVIHLISSRQQAADGSADIGTASGGEWVRRRAFKLGTLLPKSPCQPHVIGYVGGTDTVFLSVYPSVFTLDLKSRLLRKLSKQKILLRLPSDEPARLVRAALSLAQHGLRRRLPPAVPSSVLERFPFDASWVLDSRHGRVLLDLHRGHAPFWFDIHRRCFLVWDPVSGDRTRVDGQAPSFSSSRPLSYNATVLCADDRRCDHHLACRRGGPFRVVLIENRFVQGQQVAWAKVYSSAIRAWGADSNSVTLDGHSVMELRPSLLIGAALYFTIKIKGGRVGVLKYDLADRGRGRLSVVDLPPTQCRGGIASMSSRHRGSINRLMAQQLLVVGHRQAPGIDPQISWPSIAASSGRLRRGHKYCLPQDRRRVFTLDLKSSLLRNVSEKRQKYCHILPYTSFYTPEILLHLPPDKPARLVRAALVCKAWRRTVSDAGFLRRYREFYGAPPPLLGYLYSNTLMLDPLLPSRTVPSSALKRRLPSGTTWVLDSRHGLVLLDGDHDYPPFGLFERRCFLVWDPITDDSTRVYVPETEPSSCRSLSYNAAVLCAAAAAAGGPFRVVLVQKRFIQGQQVAWANVYSSETRAWGADSNSVALDSHAIMELRPSLLIGAALYFTIKIKGGRVGVLKYDLADGHGRLSVVDLPPGVVPRNAIAVEVKGGGLGFVAVLRRDCIYVVSSQRWQQADNGGTTGGGWARHKAVDKLQALLPKCRGRAWPPRVVGYVEGTNTVFLSTALGAFTLDLKSSLVRNVSEERHENCHILPYTSFYTPADELFEEILLRLPLSEPASLARAALVCKAWRRTVTDVRFLRRYRDFHGAPPLLGYIRNTYDRPRLVPTSTVHPPFSMPRHASSSSSTRIKRRPRPRWWALDCRHGRLLVCHVIGGQSVHRLGPHHRCQQAPQGAGGSCLLLLRCHRALCAVDGRCDHLPYAAAVLCAVDGCDHLRCHGGPFQVVLVGTNHIVNKKHVAWTTVYSSEAQEWGAASPSIVLNCPMFMVWTPSLLIGDVLYFTLRVPWGAAIILKYDLLGSHGLSRVDKLARPWSGVLVEADDGGIGCVSVWGNCIYLMAQQAAVIGYVEGTDTVLVSTAAGVFTLDLKSRRVTKVSDEKKTPCDILPYTTFYQHSSGTPERAILRSCESNMPPPPPALMDDAVGEILLRLPPGDPACLIRASLVCRAWHRLLSDRGFLRRYHAFHRTPPVLGFHYNHYRDRRLVSRFVPTARAPPIPQPQAAAGRPTCYALDCRHGRVLLHTTGTSNLTVWEPTTGDQRLVSLPGNPYDDFIAAVLCAEDGCDHLDCSGGPFLVVFVGTDYGSDDEGDDEHGHGVAWASVYSSETGVWSASTSIDGIDSIIEFMPSLLAGGALYFILGFGEYFLRYDLITGTLSVISSPPLDLLNMTLVTAEGGGLGVATVDGYSLHLWSWRIDSDGVGEWMRGRVIGLDATVSITLGDPSTKLNAVGFAEGADSVFISASDGIFTVELKSGWVRKIRMGGDFRAVFPFMSFCIPDHGSTRLLAPTGME